MKVALLNFDLMQVGGVVTFERQVYDMFKDGGHTPTIFYTGGVNKASRELKRDGYLTVNYKKSDWKKMQLHLERFDVIMIPQAFCKNGTPEYLYPLKGKKVFIVIHDPAEDKLKDRALLKLLLNNYEKMGIDLRAIFIRPAPKVYYEQNYGLKKTIFIKHPYKARCVEREEKKDLIISTARIDFDKHIEFIVSNLDKFAGEVRIYSSWINRVYEWHILDGKYNWKRRCYRGGFNFHEMPKLYGQAKVMIDMSHIADDGGGTQYTFLEAMDYGVAIVGNEKWNTKNGEMKPNKHYLLANEENLAERVNALLFDEKLRQSLVQGGYELLKLHHYTQILPEYIKFFEEK
jgi:hypothetical protein